MAITGSGVDRRAVVQQRLIELRMALLRRHEADRAVPMLLVVPMHELRHPAARMQQAL